MIRITVELIPRGHENHERRKTIGTMEIENDAKGNEHCGNYLATLHGEYTPADGRKVTVKAFPRKANSVWSLIGAVLKGTGHTKHSPKLIEETTPREDLFSMKDPRFK